MPLVDRNIKVPLHYQMYLDLLKRIQSGALAPGDKLPPEPQLEKIYDVSRITVRRAVEMLAQEGFVEKYRGKRGTIVSGSKHDFDIAKLTSFTDDAQLYGDRPSSELVDFELVAPEEHVAEALGVKPGESVYLIARKRFRSNVVVGFHRAYIKRIGDLDLAPNEFTPDASLYALLEMHGIVPASASEVLAVRVPSERVLAILGLDPGTAVFYKERVTRTADDEPFEYVEMFYNPSYYRYKVELQLADSPRLTRP